MDRNSIPFVAFFLFLLFIAVIVYADKGTVTMLEVNSQYIKQINFVWVSDATGEALIQTEKYHEGEVIALVFEPGTGDDAPSDNYDITINNRYGIDILNGHGMNLPQAATQTIISSTSFLPVSNEKITFDLKNAGDTNSGTAYLYYR